MAVYNADGIRIDNASGTGYVNRLIYDKPVHGINHRGYNSVAPENTLPAYRLSAQHGFKFVETDVAFTKDDVAVLIHDRSINAMARNPDGSTLSETLNVDSLTYDELLEYDFTKGKAGYSGTKIARFDDFIVLCRDLGLHAYLDLKNYGDKYSQSLVNGLVDTLYKNCMLNRVTWTCGNGTLLGYVKNSDPTARLGFMSDTSIYGIVAAQNLMTGQNEVYCEKEITTVTAEDIQRCVAAKIPLEVWSWSALESDVLDMDPYISGYISNTLNAETVLYDNNIGETGTGLIS